MPRPVAGANAATNTSTALSRRRRASRCHARDRYLQLYRRTAYGVGGARHRYRRRGDPRRHQLDRIGSPDNLSRRQTRFCGHPTRHLVLGSHCRRSRDYAAHQSHSRGHLYGNLCDMDAFMRSVLDTAYQSSRTPPKPSVQYGMARRAGTMGLRYIFFPWHQDRHYRRRRRIRYERQHALRRVLTLSNHGRKRGEARHSGRNG